MLTKIVIRNFKRFDEVEIDLGNPVVFVGPNNSGKTSALQAVALWNIGLKRWAEKRKDSKSEERYGVAINRLDLFTLPVPSTELLWRNLHLRKKASKEQKSATENIYIDIIVKGVSQGKEWEAGLEFYYRDNEVLYCRPKNMDSTYIADILENSKIKIAYLPPMSGLASNEVRLDRGAINVRIGEGRTAEVLRNLCYQILNPENPVTGTDPKQLWQDLVQKTDQAFGVILDEPEYIPERGEIRMSYHEQGGNETQKLDISASGRGLQQVLLLLSYMLANPNSILLLDEPDAHLEILRQQEIYKLLTDIALKQKNQIIIATHSEIILSEAEKDLVVAFVGKPHTIKSTTQVRKALASIKYQDYLQAEMTGWVLYLEGSTDLDVLRAFARVLKHVKAMEILHRPFVQYVGNQPAIAEGHYYGLKEAFPQLRGIGIFDRGEFKLQDTPAFCELMWQRREIENYFSFPEVLENYCEQGFLDDLFVAAENDKRRRIMKNCVEKIVPLIARENREDKWWMETKMSDDFLDRVFELYFKELCLPNTFRKSNYHELISSMKEEQVLPEVKEKLDAIVNIASK